MTRRNLVPNPAPVGTTGWSHIEVAATFGALVDASPDLHYTATVTGASASAYVVWGESPAIPVRPGERYGFTCTDVTVTSRPTTGFLRPFVLWKAILGGPPIATSFGQTNLAVGSHSADEALVVDTAPAGAFYAVPCFGFTSDASGSTGALDFKVGKLLLEPLGLPVPPARGAVTNMIPSPGLEYGTYGWVDHAPEFPGQSNLVWARQSGWSHSGTYSMRTTAKAGSTLYAPNIMGVAGSYVLGFTDATPGLPYTFQAWVNNLVALPAGSPGLFLEMFFYFFDGDPAHTLQLLHLNSAGIYTPAACATGVRQDSITGVCPVGANVVQVLSVGATNTASTFVDFYTDDCLLWQGDHVIPYFDGDSPICGWTGPPGASTSVNPSSSARAPGTYGDGDVTGWQWEGTAHASMSSQKLDAQIGGFQGGTSDVDLIDMLLNR